LLISMIVAMDRTRVIGSNGRLPWSLPADLQRFKRLTMGHALLMGRKTYDSIGRPLPGRRTIVVSRDPALQIPGCRTAAGIAAALELAAGEEELFVCGGAEIFQQLLPRTERIYLTEIDAQVAGDSYFPLVEAGEFSPLYERDFGDNGIDYRFRILQRSSCQAELSSAVVACI